MEARGIKWASVEVDIEARRSRWKSIWESGEVDMEVDGSK